MNKLRLKKPLTREESIAFTLSGKVKNFTGRGPTVIKVKFNDKKATVQLKWIISRAEKQHLNNCSDYERVAMRMKLAEDAKAILSRVFNETLSVEVDIIVTHELLQEVLVLDAHLLDMVS